MADGEIDRDSGDWRNDRGVCAVVVTYNRVDYLKRCLAALRQQTTTVDIVVVIDNASTDATDEWLRHEVPTWEGRLVYERLTRNGGGAGGFDAGMRRGLTTGADWLWCMDDDVEPAGDCLENLLKHQDLSECLQPHRIEADGTPASWEASLDVITQARTDLQNMSFSHGKSVAFVGFACFEGALVSRRLVEAIGTPDPSYFISYDDTLWGMKAAAYTNIALVRDATMYRLLPPGPTAPWKSYYLARNRFLVHRDIVSFLDLPVSPSQRLLFMVTTTLEMVRLLRLGVRHWGPALRGFRDGLAALRRARSGLTAPQRD